MPTHPIGPTWRAWLQAEAGGLRPTTIATYRRHLTSFTDHVGHHLPLADLTPNHVEGWLATMAHLQASTRRTRLAAVRAFTAWATTRHLLDTDPAAAVRAPKVRRRPPPRAKADDLARVLALAEPRDRVMQLLAAEAGKHPGAPHDQGRDPVDPRVGIEVGAGAVDCDHGDQRDKTRHPEQRGRVLRGGWGRGGQGSAPTS